MSVTFCAARIESYTYTEGPLQGQRVGRIYEIEGSPQLNFSNANARALLSSVEWEEEEICGIVDDLPKFRRHLIRAINSRTSIAQGIREKVQEGNFYDMGQSEEAVVRKLKSMLFLADFASKNDAIISYS